jgi:hypothetical protein
MQRTRHASAGARQITVLVAPYDDEVTKDARTADSSGSVGPQSSATMVYFDGFIDDYQSVDPQLSHVKRLRRARSDSRTEFTARFRCLPNMQVFVTGATGFIGSFIPTGPGLHRACSPTCEERTMTRCDLPSPACPIAGQGWRFSRSSRRPGCFGSQPSTCRVRMLDEG